MDSQSLQHFLTARGSRSFNREPDAPAKQAGFTLIELLVVMSLLLVIMGAVYGIWLGLARTYAFTDQDMAVQTQSRTAMAEMVEYIRTAREPLSVAVAGYDAVIPEAGPFSLTLWTDTNRDGSHSLQLVRFRVSPDPLVTHPAGTRFELWREEGDAETCSFEEATPHLLVTSNIANDKAEYPLFTYVDALGQPTADPTQIRQVVINLRIDVDPTHSPTVNILKSVVQPRNLRQ